ncbi:hypothetical protein SLA2020_128610 [Shorea laevis]
MGWYQAECCDRKLKSTGRQSEDSGGFLDWKTLDREQSPLNSDTNLYVLEDSRKARSTLLGFQAFNVDRT